MLGLETLFRRRPAAPAEKSKLIVIPHTHWDREWYLPFQEFRFRLVQAVDQVLDLLSSRPEYRHFTLDGQAIILEDYLEIRPERRELVKELVQQGRLSVGPWYVLPDQFLVSPEALVRNLLFGHRLSSEFGEVLRVGYLPDPFGHVRQLPQLLCGFNIDAAVLWRGVGVTERSEMHWESPDGSRVLMVYLSGGYNNVAVLPGPRDGLINRVRHVAAELREKATTEYVALMNGDDHARPQPNIPELIAHANQALSEVELTQGSLAELVDGIRASAEAHKRTFPTIEGELRSPQFSPVLPGVMSSRMWLKQRSSAAEAKLERWAEPFCVCADIVEGRTNSPGASNRGFLNVAWRNLLQNHTHDSVTGCSVDQVHEEMRTRFDACDQVAESMAQDALRRLARRVQTLGGPAHTRSQAVIVFNPEAHSRTDFVRAAVPLTDGEVPVLQDERGQTMPSQVVGRRESALLTETVGRGQLAAIAKVLGIAGADRWSDSKIDSVFRMARLLSRGMVPKLSIAGFSFAPASSARTVDVRVSSNPTGQHDYDAVRRGLAELEALIERDDVDHVELTVTKWDEAEVGFIAMDVPGLGYRTFYPVARKQGGATHEAWSSAPGTIENEYFRVQAEATSGTVTVGDKITGRLYPGLNRFADSGDAGDEYTHQPPEADRVVAAPHRPAEVSVEESGPARATIRIEQVYLLPRQLSSDRLGRSEVLVECRIVSRLHVYPQVRRIDVEAEVDNQVEDHRLRVHFPSSVRAASSSAESAFWVETRPVALPAATSDWAEQPVGTFPQRRFADVSDGRYGLLIGVKGLPEYEVLTDPEGATLALTLLRCVGWLSRGELKLRRGHAGPMLPTPGAQNLGRHRFEYCIVPHAGDWTNSYSEAHRFSLPLRSWVEDRHDGPLPTTAGFLTLAGEGVILSALKPADDGRCAVLRIYNTLPVRTVAQVRCGFDLQQVERTNLLEEAFENVALGDVRCFQLSLRPGEIGTLRLCPPSDGAEHPSGH